MLSEKPAATDILDADRLKDCEHASGLLLAVSGGPDSTALLLAADQWRRRPGRPPVFAATVDHGLRASSRREAESVGKWCDALGVSHAILTWEGPKPATRIQERARDARYALLGRCARERGVSVLLTAHHADDQYETILFRLLRGSGLAGLAGMARATEFDGLVHLRPFLDLPKQALVDFCDSLGHPYFSDASNEDPRFARTRLRRAASTLADLGFGQHGLFRLARRAARADRALRSGYGDFLQRATALRTDARLVLRRPALVDAEDEFLVRLACEEPRRLGGGPGPRLEQAEKLAQSLRRALADGDRLRVTLGGIIYALDEAALELRKEGLRRATAKRPREPSDS